MEIAFFNVLGSGHVNPTLPVVRALTERGDRVTYFTYPPRRAEVEAVGATFHNYGDDDFSVARYHPKGSFPTQLLPATVGILPYLVDEVRRLAPDLIVSDSMAPWGLAVAQVLGIPALGSVTTFALGRTMIQRLRAASSLAIDDANLEAISTLRAKWSVIFSPDDVGSTYAPTNLVYTARSFNPPLDGRGETFEFVGPLIGRPAGEPDFAMQDLGAGGRKRLFISMGTILGKMRGLGAAFYQPFFDAFGPRDDYRVVLAVGDGVAPESLAAPANFIVRRWVPQVALLPHVDAFITHAGMNSTSEAMAHGVPILALPFMGDQPINAGQVVALGAGLQLDPDELHAAALLAGVERLLGEPAFRRAAQAIGTELRRAGGVPRALEVVDRLGAAR